MPLLFNWRHLEKKNLVLNGELPYAEMDLDGIDECIKGSLPLQYSLEVQLFEEAFLVRGRLSLPLQFTCVRCLKTFQRAIEFPDWVCHLPRTGDDKVPIINDCVDLTPFMREDIVLAFPQHPLCETGCNGLPPSSISSVHQTTNVQANAEKLSAWAELDKLKL